MKRNKTTNRVARSRPRDRYAKKRAFGKQMYGPGCCAHKQRSRLLSL